MKRDVDGSLGRQMLRHEGVELRHDGLNAQRVLLEKQRRIVLLDNQRGFRSRFAIARFVLTCADAANAVSVYAHKQILRRLHTPFPRDSQQSHFDIVDNGCHRDLRFTEQDLSKSKRSLTGDHWNVQPLPWLRRVFSCASQNRDIYSRRFLKRTLTTKILAW